MSMIDIWSVSYEKTFGWMSRDITDDKSTLVQVMVWCRQAPNHYLNQSRPKSTSPYCVTGPQCVNHSVLKASIHHNISGDGYKYLLILLKQMLFFICLGVVVVNTMHCDWQWFHIGYGNGLVPDRHQIIPYTLMTTNVSAGGLSINFTKVFNWQQLWHICSNSCFNIDQYCHCMYFKTVTSCSFKLNYTAF